jgi:hypothetical protein
MKDIRTQWKALASAKNITSEDIAALCFYRTIYKEHTLDEGLARIRKSFKPITNSSKLENGAYPYGSLQLSLRNIKYSTLVSWLDEDDKLKIIAMAKDVLSKMTWNGDFQ